MYTYDDVILRFDALIAPMHVVSFVSRRGEKYGYFSARRRRIDARAASVARASTGERDDDDADEGDDDDGARRAQRRGAVRRSLARGDPRDRTTDATRGEREGGGAAVRSRRCRAVEEGIERACDAREVGGDACATRD